MKVFRVHTFTGSSFFPLGKTLFWEQNDYTNIPWADQRLPPCAETDYTKKLVWSVCVMCMLSRFTHVRLCDLMYHSLPGFSVHGILQARILEWVAITFCIPLYVLEGWLLHYLSVYLLKTLFPVWDVYTTHVVRKINRCLKAQKHLSLFTVALSLCRNKMLFDQNSFS